MIDANVAVWTVLPAIAQIDVFERVTHWQESGVPLWAPTHWTAEAVSAIRRAIYARVIGTERGLQAIDDLFALEVELLPMETHRCQSALAWAGRVNQSRAYDGFYLALAEELGAEFWTADRRLANAAQQAGVTWAHWIGEAAAGE